MLDELATPFLTQIAARLTSRSIERRARAVKTLTILGLKTYANEVVRAFAGDRADLKLLVPAALAGAAVVSFFKRPVLPRWDNLLWWSYSTFRDLNGDAIDRAGKVDLSALREKGPKT